LIGRPRATVAAKLAAVAVAVTDAIVVVVTVAYVTVIAEFLYLFTQQLFLTKEEGIPIFVV
jgi:hypothetical protein